jgi:hypothetical protein
MRYQPDGDGYVNFGDVSRNELGIQCQYGARFIVGRDIPGCEDEPDLGQGLRFRNLDIGDYHSIEIHIDDIPELLRRFKAYKQECENPPMKIPWWKRIFFCK